MMDVLEAKAKLVRLAELSMEEKRIRNEFNKTDFFSDLCVFEPCRVLTGCTIDSEGLKDSEGNLISTDGRCMDEPLGYFVNQSVGYLGDDFYGHMYITVDENGTFVDVYYEC